MGPNTVSPTQSGGALIAMSGGVDSSIAAYLTMQTGCPCLGATMRLYRNVDIGKNPQRTCCAQKDIDDASQVAFQLDLPYEVLDRTSTPSSSPERKKSGKSIALVFPAGRSPSTWSCIKLCAQNREKPTLVSPGFL